MSLYRDPDDIPVDPALDDELIDRPAPRTTAPWRPVDPDALRPARLDDDELAVDPEDPPGPHRLTP